MKKVLSALALTVACLTPLAAQAAWVAEATSPSAWGKGYSYDKLIAIRIALRECAIRTPNTQTCYVQAVYWVND